MIRMPSNINQLFCLYDNRTFFGAFSKNHLKLGNRCDEISNVLTDERVEKYLAILITYNKQLGVC